MSRQEWLVPDEVREVWIEFEALLDLRDRYTNIPLGYKRAKRASIDAQRARREFWEKLNDLYPEAWDRKGTVNYDVDKNVIFLKVPEDG